MQIDLNCDMGESYGHFRVGNDEEMMKWITSANVACGFHAGDSQTLLKTLQLAKYYQVAVGAHPGFPDLVGFGRREMKLSAEELYADLIYQIGAIQAVCKVVGIRLQHVKVHGALYNMATRDEKIAETIIKAVYDIDPNLIIFGISGSALLEMAKQKGLPIAREFFADRTYLEDGSLTPRSFKDAYIQDPIIAAERVIRLISENIVVTSSGQEIKMEADTVCLHGDGEFALSFAKQINKQLLQAGISLKPLIDL